MKYENSMVNGICACDDCIDRERDCHMDCDRESECQGCTEARQGQAEDLFEAGAF